MATRLNAIWVSATELPVISVTIFQSKIAAVVRKLVVNVEVSRHDVTVERELISRGALGWSKSSGDHYALQQDRRRITSP